MSSTKDSSWPFTAPAGSYYPLGGTPPDAAVDTPTLPTGFSSDPSQEAFKHAWCAHEWVDAGFVHSNIVCKKCDAKHPNPENF